MNINSITLHNFKAFREQKKIELPARHTLVWGANGSGKSSIFWALHLILQSAWKGADGITKYFDNSPENLRHLCSEEAEDSWVEIHFKNEEGNTQTCQLGKMEGNIHFEMDESFIRTTNSSSDFLTHRLLSNFYNFPNSKTIDLFPVFLRDIFPYFQVQGMGESFASLYQNLLKEVNRENKPNLDHWIGSFNNSFLDLMVKINDDATQFYQKHFSFDGEEIKIELLFEQEMRLLGTTKRNRKISDPILQLKISRKMEDGSFKKIERPQTFLNVARLNAIALSIRFVLLQSRPESACNILAVDDLLLSLDIPNRLKVTRVILNELSSRFQLFIFTHDRGFYREVIRNIHRERAAWNLFEVYETPLEQNPKITEGKTAREQMIAHFDRKEYEACGLLLRKMTEEILRSYLDPEMKWIWEGKKFKSLTDLVNLMRDRFSIGGVTEFNRVVGSELSNDEIALLKRDLQDEEALTANPALKGKLGTLRNRMVDIVLNHRSGRAHEIHQLLDKISQINERVMNPSAHFGEAPLFEGEIKEAIEIVKELRQKIQELTETV